MLRLIAAPFRDIATSLSLLAMTTRGWYSSISTKNNRRGLCITNLSTGVADLPARAPRPFREISPLRSDFVLTPVEMTSEG